MQSSIQKKILLFFVLSCFFLNTFQTFSFNAISNLSYSNGSVVYAYPVEQITIDGISNDWPKSLEKHYITKTPFGELPKKEDFEAYFQIGHNLNENALYVLLTVIDDKHVTDESENADWNTQDTYTLYLDYKHDWNGSGVNLFQYGENYKREYDYSKSWDPEVATFNWDKVTMKSSRNGNVTTYEVKIDLGELLQLNKSIGIDHMFVDKDPDDGDGVYSFVSWGAYGGKSQSPTRLGDVIPVAGTTKIAEVEGKVSWENDSITEMPDRIALINKNDNKQWSVAIVDSLGNYSTQLPEGDYITKPFWEFRSNYRIDIDKSQSAFQVKENRTQNANMVLKTKSPLNLIPETGILKDFDPNSPEKLDNFIKTYQEYYVIPGVSLAIIKDGKVAYHKTYGNQNAVTRKAVNDKTLFEAASITKPVFGFAVCRLAEKGVIDLDKPLHTYLPFEDIAHDERYKLITARHVLTHKTGFPNWAYNNDDGKIDIKFTPGTDYGYSGEGFEYLKHVVNKITGKDVEAIVQEEVLTPLGIENTYFSENEYMKTHASNGHYGRNPSPKNLPQGPGMAWSMHTESKTFSNFALGLLERKGLKTETYEDMFKKHTKVDDDEAKDGWEYFFGLGIALEKTPFGPAFGHGGKQWRL